ncbi:hypothetical protein TSMEX_005595 [Taenia solium]|eukprot:TsM_000890800 transcript=TsM_000890800 gene=TsM_000890800
MTSLVGNAALLKGFNFLRFCSFPVPVPIGWREEVGTTRLCSPGHGHVIFFYQTEPNQYQPRIAYDFPRYLRGACEVCIQFAGMHWMVRHKFKGSSWLTTFLATKVMNERWVTLGTVEKADVRINITKMWFKFPIFTACCHPIKTKRTVRLPDFTIPDRFADVQLAPQDPNNRKLLASSSPGYEFTLCVHNFLRFIHPNTDFEIGPLNVGGLMNMGKGYQIPYVIRQCEKFLYKYMEGGSAVLAYYLGHKHELPALQDAALLRLAELNSSQLRSRIALDMKDKTADTQEILLNDLCVRLSG